MKAAFEKAVSAISSYARANPRRQDPTVTVGCASDSEQYRTELQSVYDTRTAFQPVISSTTEGDDILFSKNNILLKHPIDNVSVDACQKESPLFPNELFHNEDYAESLDNHILIPGFFFVATRGSNVGTTLILNWAPNSSMKVPVGDHVPIQDLVDDSSNDDQPREFLSKSCSSISIDLCSMEMIRIFYRMDESGFIISGELVVKSKEESFKVFYFKNGGLSDLVYILRSRKCFNHTCHKDSHCHTFTVYSPKLKLSELHRLEGKFTLLTSEVWESLKDNSGRINDPNYVTKVIFFQGVHSKIRKTVWPYLLNLFPYTSTDLDKVEIMKKLHDDYTRLNSEKCAKHPTNVGVADEYEYLRNQIEKDVIRTDRLSSYYSGDDNEHLSSLLNILLNYLHYIPGVSYTQGMTDLLAPILSVVDDDVEAFWCFVNLMEFSCICKTEKKLITIKRQMELLRHLLQMLIPSFYEYLEITENGLSLMFCHRWLLVFLKREFSLTDILSIWETCWSCCETKFFHLFICIAIIAIYGERALEKNMNIDELMVYFNTLSNQISKDIVLCQARGYLNKFCQSKQVNCILYELMNQEFWTLEGSPKLFCSVCQGFGFCNRTGYLTNKEMIC